MKRSLIAAATIVCFVSTQTQAKEVIHPPKSRQTLGLTAGEAQSLIDKLVAAQDDMRARKRQYFDILSGSYPESPMADISPKSAFLNIDFNEVWNVEAISTSNRLWQRYRLSYAPDGLGKSYWDIELVLGLNENLERIQMLYKAPAPI